MLGDFTLIPCFQSFLPVKNTNDGYNVWNQWNDVAAGAHLRAWPARSCCACAPEQR